MSARMNRRDFLRSAGGVTFLALSPAGRGLFAAPAAAPAIAPRLPLFTVLPYIQPGPGSRVQPGAESMVVAWQTLERPADFAVEYGPSRQYGLKADVVSVSRFSGGSEEGEGRLNYQAALRGLEPARMYYYRVRGNRQLLAEGYFTTRQPRGQKVRFAAFGDNSYGEMSDRAIAYHVYQAHPDFVMNVGDNVYEGGLDNEYARLFFPVYNSDVAALHAGAPLLRSVPYYTVIANHDVHRKDADGHPVADFKADPDSLAYYTAMHLPRNGPAPAQPTPIVGPDSTLHAFLQAAGDRYPRTANYSYDYGDAHFLCLDSNVYVDPTNKTLQSWIEQDLAGTDAPWKFVIHHHPAFNVGEEHYKEQQMRVLSPIFEKHGVSFVLSGHEHVYQRNRPLRFTPHDTSAAAAVNEKDRRTPGAFTIDRTFDGVRSTRPDGILYVTTGAGGKHLYDVDFTNRPDLWLRSDDSNADYVVRFVSDRHSFSLFEVDGNSVTMTQIDEEGTPIDHLEVVRPGA